MKVWALLKETRVTDGYDTHVHSVHPSLDSVHATVHREASKRGFRPEPLGRHGTAWRIGPDEDEGFFGRTPICFYASEHELEEEVPHESNLG